MQNVRVRGRMWLLRSKNVLADTTAQNKIHKKMALYHLKFKQISSKT